MNERPKGASIDTLVLHYTGMRTADDALERLCNPESQVSAHYLIDEEGTCVQMVEENQRAWHAGVSHWRGRDGVNDVSIGIELVNPGHEFGYRPFPEAQMQSLIRLCQEIMTRHPIPARNVIGHSDIAPDRKEDPGELFDWERLAGEGIGLWPGNVSHLKPNPTLSIGQQGPAITTLQARLATYGYGLQQTGQFDAQTLRCVIAFQRHFRPSALCEYWDNECEARLDALLAAI